jgi:tetratricopeptide (TPR) repeat protein
MRYTLHDSLHYILIALYTHRTIYSSLIAVQFAIEWADGEQSSEQPKKTATKGKEKVDAGTPKKEGQGMLVLVRPVLLCAVGVMICLYSVKTIERDLVWNNEIDLYRTAIEAYPSNAKAHHNLGTYLPDSDPAKEHHFRQAIKWHPRYTSAYVNLGVVLAKSKREDESAVVWRQGIDQCKNHRMINDGLDAMIRNLNIAYRNLGRGDHEGALLQKEFPWAFGKKK